MATQSILAAPIGATYVRIDTSIRPNPTYFRLKRILDLAITLPVLPVVGLVLAVLCVVIRLDSKGPAIFRQRRVGRYGVEFELLKLRSMYTDSDEQIHREAIGRYLRGEKLNQGGAEGVAYKLGDDPRVTRVGRFIRATALDELPQLWNVFKGDMSLVGPRPPLAYEVDLYNQRDLLRLSGKPGLTGPWQVYARSRVGFHEMVEMDIAYQRQESLAEDLKLIALTVPVMLARRGGA
jgi:lipopolysaccharide/colanic/teichoic acid biosynthesis glycosyltransferase